jgi:DNA-binding response OmpR family regulator
MRKIRVGVAARRVEDVGMGGVPTKRVLVVGDRPEIGAVVEEVLTRYGYQVRHASHSAAASVMLTEREGLFPHVAILDTGRFLKSSVTVMKFIRGTMRSSLPVIVLTAGATEEHEAEFQRLGVNWLLWKPVSAAELVSAVAAATG